MSLFVKKVVEKHLEVADVDETPTPNLQCDKRCAVVG